MLHRLIEDFKGDAVVATDGEIGSLADAYFDDERWRLRYLVIDTGRWLPGHKVLVSPQAMAQDEERVMRVKLTREEVQRSPGIDADPPVSHLLKLAHQRDYVYPYAGPYLWGMLPPARPPLREELPRSPARREAEVQAQQRAERSHLRSGREVTGYRIHAADGEIGHVEDFIVDDTDWAITGVVVDTRNWLPGKKVVVPPQAIEAIDADEQTVRVRLSREEIKRGPQP